MAEVTARLTEGLAVALQSGSGHHWRADEPEGLGGSGTGPDPYELVLGGLAACMCITVAMYCERHGWSLREIAVECSHERIHADDCGDCAEDMADRAGRVERITSDVTIRGDLDDGQRQRLTEIVSRCPVHRTLGRELRLTEDVAFA